jgi:hypothetical protein
MAEADMTQEQFKQACEDHRFYGDMRFKVLTLFAVTMGALLTALLAPKPDAQIAASSLIVLSVIGLGLTAVLWTMEVRSTIFAVQSRTIIEALGGGNQDFRPRLSQVSATNSVLLLYMSAYFGWAVFLDRVVRVVQTRWTCVAWSFGMLLFIYSVMPLWKRGAYRKVTNQQESTTEQGDSCHNEPKVHSAVTALEMKAGTESADKISVNLKARKTEAGWAATLDRIGMKAAPMWFDWLKWILVLVTIAYSSRRTHGRSLSAVYFVSMVFFYLNIQGWLYSFEFRGLPLVRTEGQRRLASICLSGVLTAVMWRWVSFAVDLLVQIQK